MKTYGEYENFPVATNAGECRLNAGEESPAPLTSIHQQPPVKTTSIRQNDYKS